MLAAAGAHDIAGYVLAFFTAAFASANLAGGYAVTDRMLEMFKTRPKAGPTDRGGGNGPAGGSGR
jgi:NAD(P) transhydrogenase subunit alpha